MRRGSAAGGADSGQPSGGDRHQLRGEELVGQQDRAGRDLRIGALLARQGRQLPELVKVQQAPPLPARHGGSDSRPDLVRGNILHPAAPPGPGPGCAICQPRRARYWSKPELSGQRVAERKAKTGGQELPAQRRAEQQPGTVLCHWRMLVRSGASVPTLCRVTPAAARS